MCDGRSTLRKSRKRQDTQWVDLREALLKTKQYWDRRPEKNHLGLQNYQTIEDNTNTPAPNTTLKCSCAGRVPLSFNSLYFKHHPAWRWNWALGTTHKGVSAQTHKEMKENCRFAHAENKNIDCMQTFIIPKGGSVLSLVIPEHCSHAHRSAKPTTIPSPSAKSCIETKWANASTLTC